MLSITKDQFDKCCEITSCSAKSLATVCKEIGASYGGMRNFIASTEEYQSKYARAKEDQADYLAEEMLDIADDKNNDVNVTDDGRIVENREFTTRSKLRVDTRKWIAEHLKPKKWGQKQEIEVNNVTIARSIGLPAKVSEGAKVNDNQG